MSHLPVFYWLLAYCMVKIISIPLADKNIFYICVDK